MRLIFIGDIFGRSGREAVEKHLPALREEYNTDFVIANVDNAAHGRGITPKVADELFDLGIDCLTGGNHIWDQREIIPYIQKNQNLIRAHNMPKQMPGKGMWESATPDGRKIVVIHLMARLFMEMSDDPFQEIDRVLKTYKLGQNCNTILVDCHGEATSEKMALGHYLDGKISGFFGTHTHIPTADDRILENGTAYQSDTGMTGFFESVIGVKKEAAIGRFLKKVPGERFHPAEGEATLCAVFLETSDKTGHALKLIPIRRGGTLNQAG